MLFNRLSIQLRITLLAGLCLLLIVSLLVVASVTQASRNASLVSRSSTEMLQEAAQLRLTARGEAEALQVQRYFAEAYGYGEAVAREVLLLRQQARQTSASPQNCARSLPHTSVRPWRPNPACWAFMRRS